MNYKLLMDTAVLAGEIMLRAGAETFRVEDTINRILKNADLQTTEAFVIPTGFFATLDDPSIDAITVTKRINDRSTNLNKIYKVNNISRMLCEDTITVEAAYEALIAVTKEKQYSALIRSICIIFVAASFTMLLGGRTADGTAAAVTGAVLAFCWYWLKKWKINIFMQDLILSAVIAIMSVSSMYCFSTVIRYDLVIIGAIMPLVPGVAITNAIRDTLQGDYMSGGTRALEAFVTAAAIAIGVGVGLGLIQAVIGGI